MGYLTPVCQCGIAVTLEYVLVMQHSSAWHLLLECLSVCLSHLWSTLKHSRYWNTFYRNFPILGNLLQNTCIYL